MTVPSRPDPRWRPRITAIDLGVVRAVLRRSRWPRWLLVVGLALMGGTSFDRAHGAALAAEAAWRPATGAWLALGDLPAGSVVDPTDVEHRLLPAALLPRDAVADEPFGLRLSDDVVAGEILRSGRLRDPTSSVVGAILPDGTGGLRLPTAAPHLHPGDSVDLYALLTGDRVATRAEVLAVDEGMATVAIADADLPAVVRTFTTGDVVAVIVG